MSGTGRTFDAGPGFVRARECAMCGHTRCGPDCRCDCGALRVPRMDNVSWEMITDWVARLSRSDVDHLYAEARRARAAEDEQAATLRSLACMLGWSNVPPREALERTLSALKRRAEASTRAAREAVPAEAAGLLTALRDVGVTVETREGGNGYAVTNERAAGLEAERAKTADLRCELVRLAAERDVHLARAERAEARTLHVALANATEAASKRDRARLHTVNESVQPVVDAFMGWVMEARQDADRYREALAEIPTSRCPWGCSDTGIHAKTCPVDRARSRAALSPAQPGEEGPKRAQLCPGCGESHGWRHDQETREDVCRACGWELGRRTP